MPFLIFAILFYVLAVAFCTYAFACLGKETMPTKDRGSISHIYPTGWEQAKYDFIEGKSLSDIENETFGK